VNRTPKAPSRRGHTRWMLLAPVAVLALLVAGVVGLEAVHPQVPTEDRLVTGIPPLALAEDRSCTRPVDDGRITDIRAELSPGDRISSTQVYLCPTAFDLFDVTYVGEVVGELIPRRGGAWAQINDDPYALEVGPLIGHRERSGFNTGLSVWLPDGLHEHIEGVGRPGVRGDVVVVRGTLLRTDPNDGGGITLRAEQLEIVAETQEVEVPFHTLQAVVAGVLSLLALAALLHAQRARRR
jgi:hypothetical protein